MWKSHGIMPSRKGSARRIVGILYENKFGTLAAGSFINFSWTTIRLINIKMALLFTKSSIEKLKQHFKDIFPSVFGNAPL